MVFTRQKILVVTLLGDLFPIFALATYFSLPKLLPIRMLENLPGWVFKPMRDSKCRFSPQNLICPNFFDTVHTKKLFYLKRFISRIVTKFELNLRRNENIGEIQCSGLGVSDSILLE